MQTFLSRELVSGVLVPLPQLLARLNPINIDFWIFRDITLQYGHPFGYSIREFEKITRDIPDGYCATAAEFDSFLHTPFQIIDGEIDAVSASLPEQPLLHIECIDASQWELTTASDDMAARLDANGFERMRGDSSH